MKISLFTFASPYGTIYSRFAADAASAADRIPADCNLILISETALLPFIADIASE